MRIQAKFVARALLACTALACVPVHAQEGGQLNVICSVQAEWCNMIQTVFAKTTGIKVNMSLKGSGEALAQLIAERANSPSAGCLARSTSTKRSLMNWRYASSLRASRATARMRPPAGSLPCR